MPPKRKYTRRVNSNGKDWYPTVCATHYKLPQNEGDTAGAYILDYFKKAKEKAVQSVDTRSDNVVK